jgi:polyphosphate kinase
MTHLVMAPFTLRSTLLQLIADETARAKNNEKAEIFMKMNGLSDEELIEALYAASKAGVRVRLNVRGVCCLRPGVPKLSDKISVVSIIDRYLEHARIYSFHNGGRKRIFIASADGMLRNLSKRVELMIPIVHPVQCEALSEILKTYFKDNTKASALNADGEWTRVKPKAGEPVCQSQRLLYEQAHQRTHLHTQARPTSLEPWKSKSKAKPSRQVAKGKGKKKA